MDALPFEVPLQPCTRIRIVLRREQTLPPGQLHGGVAEEASEEGQAEGCRG